MDGWFLGCIIMHDQMDSSLDGWMIDRWMDEWMMDGQKDDSCMDVQTYVHMHDWMDLLFKGLVMVG